MSYTRMVRALTVSRKRSLALLRREAVSTRHKARQVAGIVELIEGELARPRPRNAMLDVYADDIEGAVAGLELLARSAAQRAREAATTGLQIHYFERTPSKDH